MHVIDEFIKMIKNLINGDEVTSENIRGVMIVILSICFIYYIF